MKISSLHVSWKNVLLSLWVVFSFVYISYNVYENFKNQVIQNAYMAGKTDTINALITQAENKECKPFSVYAGEKKADLINISCLEQKQPEKK